MEEPEFIVVLTDAGERRIEVIRVVRSLTGLGPWQSSLLLEDLPATVGAGCLRDLDGALARLREAGAHATARCRSCGRDAPQDGTLIDPGPCDASAPWASYCPASRTPPRWGVVDGYFVELPDEP
ncbi:ribosomal protein L7/L12 [Kitasatospora sp. RG8]|uniref:ribosomal protein L7/L12 n=1 Tax=Kitasatospora sp. RG8 TaxID=2820815 RepID=UPI001ADF7E44|nr:ribosomal protein L7/L12 [Kitasatospora sp. RG8]MBP0454888.1 ribosomal protein L7/L12 [Kitasatospora sp. RG8]